MAASAWRGMAGIASTLGHHARRSLQASSIIQSVKRGSGFVSRTRDVGLPGLQLRSLTSGLHREASSACSSANMVVVPSSVHQLFLSAICTGPRVCPGRPAWNYFAMGTVRCLGGEKDKHRRVAWKKVPGLGLPGGGKIKTHKGVSKRFTVTRRGKVGYHAMGRNHFNYGTSGRKRQQLRKKRFLSSKKQAKTIRQLLVKDRRPRFPYCPPGEPLKLRATPLPLPLNEKELMDYTPIKERLKLVQKKKFLAKE